MQADALLAVQLSQKCSLLICVIPGVSWANSHSQFFPRHASTFCCISLLSCSHACSLSLSLIHFPHFSSTLSWLGFVCFGFTGLWWESDTFPPFSRASSSNWKHVLGNILIYPEVITIGLRPYPWLDPYFKADFNWSLFIFFGRKHVLILYFTAWDWKTIASSNPINTSEFTDCPGFLSFLLTSWANLRWARSFHFCNKFPNVSNSHQHRLLTFCFTILQSLA